MGGFNIQSDDGLSSSRITYENGGSNATVIIPKDGGKLSVGTHLNGLAPYHLLEGKVELLNTVSTPAVSSTVYTGTAANLDINAGIDLDSQWGNLLSERFGGLVLIKGDNATDTILVDSIRGVGSTIYWNSPIINASSKLNYFSSTGFQVNNNTNVNASGVNYQSLAFGTNRRRTGTTNHGMSFTEHYNMESGFTILSWYGSGKDRHEIPHMLGRKFDFYMIKNLTTGTVSWQSNYDGQRKNNYLTPDSILQEYNADNIDIWSTDSLLNVSNTDRINYSGQQYVCYAWCSSYLDADKKLIGNYEIVKYIGGKDITTSSLLRTKAKPLAVIFKALDADSNWVLATTRSGVNKVVNLNDNTTSISNGNWTFNNNGIQYPTVMDAAITPGVTYIAIIIYDNDNGSGKSLYPRSNDSTLLNLNNAKIPLALGLDSSGSHKVTTINKNEVISGLTLYPGKNFISINSNGVYSNSTYNPNYNTYSGFGDYYDSVKNKWYKNVSILSDNFTSDTVGNYTASNASLSILNGKLKIQNTGTSVRGAAYRTITTIVGKRYALVYDFNATDYWSGVLVGTSVLGIDLLAIGNGVDLKGSGVTYFTATTNTTYVALVTTATTGVSAVYDHIAIYPVNNDFTVDTSNATEILDSRNYLSTIVYADHNSQPVYVEKITSSVYNKDVVLTGNVDFNNVEKINSNSDYNFNINGKKKLTITENGILNQDGKAFSTGGFKNLALNGNFNVWQRGTNISCIGQTRTYTADRWIMSMDATGGNCTTTYAPIDTWYGRNINSILVTINTVGSNTYFDLTQELEDVMQYAGKTITVSFLHISDSNTPLRAHVGRCYNQTDGVMYSSGIALGNGYATNLKRYSFTYKVPAYAGETYVKGQSFLRILIRHDRTTTGAFRMAEFQVEEGSIPTPFEFRLPQLELMMCQRYYQTWGAFLDTYNLSGRLVRIAVPFRVTMRGSTTITITTNNSIYVNTLSTTNVTTQEFTLAGISGNTEHVTLAAYGTASSELTN